LPGRDEEIYSNPLILSVATIGNIDIEDLVDDFTTFYVAGKLADLNNFIIVVQKLGLAFLISNRGTARLTKF